jgi:hypothetical protein
MNKLSGRIQHPEKCADDTTILTIIGLGVIEYMLGNHSAARAHVAGMRQVISIRGGGIQGNTPWDILMRTNLAAYESLWSFLFAAEAHMDDPNRHQSQIVAKAEFPVYVRPP